MTSKYLLIFMTLAITLELLDIIFRGYTAVKSWDILRDVIYEHDFVKIFILQYRITSYNVCYTKLLRGAFCQNSGGPGVARKSY